MPATATRPHVVIIGGGFGGLTAAKALARAPVNITVIDRRNHHLFQPLLYQVATASLSPAQIAAPIRKVLSKFRNAEVLLAEVTRIDAGKREVILTDGVVSYDYLIVAAGATHSYFGHDDWGAYAPGLKTIEDAVDIRRRFLLAFEHAEREKDAAARRAELTFVVVGAGPTGVEMAGAMAEIARSAIPKDFRSIDTTTARIVLVEALDRVLPGFPEGLSRRAKRDLEQLGVEVRLNARVTGVDGDGVSLEVEDGRHAERGGTQRIAARNAIWAAGVLASPLGATLGVELDRSGRVKVEPDLSIRGHPEVFVVGDLALVIDPKSGGQAPGVAPAAMQMGRFVAWTIAKEATGFRDRTYTTQKTHSTRSAGSPSSRRPFVYKDKGLLATIGRARAVAAIGKLHFAGFFAWAFWAAIHIFYLIGFRAKLLVVLDWAWAYVVFERGARLITGETRSRDQGVRDQVHASG